MRNVKLEKGKLYGIGIGPGDPDLITLKAKKVLEASDTIFVPKADREGISRARSIIEKTISRPKKIVELVFPMTNDKNMLRKCWRQAAEKIAGELQNNRTSSFVTMGDPFTYSTYIHLLRTLHRDFPGIDTETIPGITAFNAAASKAQIPLVEAKEKMAILAVPENLRGLKDAFKKFDTVVLMKVGAKLEKIINLLTELGLINSAVLISHVGHPEETIVKNLSLLKNKKQGYLSIIIVKSKKHKAKSR